MLLLAAGVIAGIEAAELLGIRSGYSPIPCVGVAGFCALLVVSEPFFLRFGERRDDASGEPYPAETEETRYRDGADALGLSAGERRAVELTLQGLSSSQAAVKMGVKAPTVRSYLQRAYKKAGVTSFNELKLYLSGGPDGEILEEQEEAPPYMAFLFSCLAAMLALLVSLVYFLPAGDFGLPASALFSGVPVGLLIWVALRPVPSAAVSLLGAASSLLLGVSFVAISFAPEMGWTARWAAAAGLFSTGLTFWTAGVFEGRAKDLAESRSAWEKRAPLALLAAIAALGISCCFPFARGLIVCVLSVACGVLSLVGAKMSRQVPRTQYVVRRVSPAQLAGVFYLGAIACDASVGYDLYFNYPLAAICAFLIVCSWAVGLRQSLAGVRGRAAIVALVIGGVAAVALHDGCVAVILTVSLGLVLLAQGQKGEDGIDTGMAAAISYGVVACLCLEKVEFSLPMTTEVDFRGVLELTVLKTLVFSAGSIICGGVLLLQAIWGNDMSSCAVPYEVHVLQYLQARGLSPLESKIVAGVARGDSAAMIARENTCALGTVNSARHRAYGLLEVHSKDELAELLRRDLRTSSRL